MLAPAGAGRSRGRDSASVHTVVQLRLQPRPWRRRRQRALAFAQARHVRCGAQAARRQHTPARTLAEVCGHRTLKVPQHRRPRLGRLRRGRRAADTRERLVDLQRRRPPRRCPCRLPPSRRGLGSSHGHGLLQPRRLPRRPRPGRQRRRGAEDLGIPLRPLEDQKKGLGHIEEGVGQLFAARTGPDVRTNFHQVVAALQPVHASEAPPADLDQIGRRGMCPRSLSFPPLQFRTQLRSSTQRHLYRHPWLSGRRRNTSLDHPTESVRISCVIQQAFRQGPGKTRRRHIGKPFLFHALLHKFDTPLLFQEV
mmetsp:Transcript_48623/g.156081  ORF Transcript_48623/g.156081 Transcript_48623/m.156081 type:complete len:309 (+) Transcript_48623:201-1127(+)